ncbi:hypothetical protein [Lacinutrix sp. 5H-3-7-4]|uniref:hypothetical protein n=1 Tax=Lacinutrix sp. (strain 5H-3-7-4) TaxID=983544 RepID=UPI00020A33F8|nr:hypothetical protein [Lacinutrix sp. 5H-3-7-4]AEH02364.1 hypothetical protein Lacal_2523 [Lacinutrix sp. 5H-3-7-4]
MSSKPISDLHNHPSLKPYGNPANIKDIWDYFKNKEPKDYFKQISVRKWIINLVLKKMATYSQSNLDSCFKGNNRLIFCSVYPIEKQFLKPVRPFKKSTGVHRFILGLIFGKQFNSKNIAVDKKIVSLLAGISIKTASRLIDPIHDNSIDTIDYFNDYIFEYQFLLHANRSTSQQSFNGINPKFQLVKNYEHFLEMQANDTICGIMTIEGMHGLGVYNKNDLFETEKIESLPLERQNKLKLSFIENIEALKKEMFPPFFITFAHHFNNLLVGHAKSFMDGKGTFDPGFSDIFDQTLGQDLGISSFGAILISDHLLSRENGQRILIDIKHMSVLARKSYYNMLAHFREKSDALHDNIPIISSHTAISGIKTLDDALHKKDNFELDKNSYVSLWDINLTDEDIVEIFKSDGLIGICMHDGRMPGNRFRKLLKKADAETTKKLHVQLFLTNVFHIVKVNLNYIRTVNKTRTTSKIDEVEAWKTVCLGSDNDGIVDPFDHYSTAADLPTFRAKILESLNHYVLEDYVGFNVINLPDETQFTIQELDDLMVGQPFVEAIDKLFYNNTDAFLSKYFTKTYLNQTEADFIV